MNVHFGYKNCKTPNVEKVIHHLIEKLRKRLQVFRPELVHLKGLIEQNSAREGITVSLNLRLPSGQMAVQTSASTAAAAVKAASDDLLQQLSKHKEVLRSSRKWQRRRVAGFRAESQVPFEETVAAVRVPTASSDDIRSYVNANLGRLERFVERELYFREAADEILPDLVSKEGSSMRRSREPWATERKNRNAWPSSLGSTESPCASFRTCPKALRRALLRFISRNPRASQTSVPPTSLSCNFTSRTRH